MKMKSVLLLAVALGCGLVAMLGVQQVMSSGPPPEEQKAPDTTRILIASQDIQPFTLLDDSNTTFKEVPANLAPEGAITSRSEYADFRLRYFAAKGDPIQISKLADKNYAPSQEIDPGMTVVTVKVDQTKSHSGLIRPGDLVNVVLTYKSAKPGRPSQLRTVTVLERVKVFSIDDKRLSNSQDADGNDLKAKNISLSVTPEHGNLLMLAVRTGTLTLSLLRRAGEGDKSDSPSIAKTSVDASVFDNLGKPDQSDTGKKTAPQKAPLNSFRQFLTNSQNGKKTGDKPVNDQNTKDERPAKPKWKLTIYEGKTPRIEEIELPETAAGKEKSSKDGPNG